MSRVKLFVLSLLLVSFALCTFGVSSNAQIGPGGDMPVAGGNMPSNGPDRIGPGGDRPSDSPKGLNGILEGPRPLVLTPVEPLGLFLFYYEVFNATPGGEVYIISGFENDTRNTLICPDLKIDIVDLELENVLIADDLGYAYAEIYIADSPIGIGYFYMQAIDKETCRKSNLTMRDY